MIDIAMLRAIGITDAQLAKLFELVKKADLEKAAAEREANRIRQRNQRARTKSHSDARDIAYASVEIIEQSPSKTPPSANGTELANSLSSLKDSLFKKESKQRSVRTAGAVCPLDFTPNDGDYELGTKYGYSRQQVDARSAGMVEWSHANRNRAIARKSDWHLTLRGILRRDGKPPATADPRQTEGGRELARKTEEYKAQLAARKKNRNGGEAQFELVRRNPNGSGEGSADQKPEIVLQKGEGIHGKEQPPRKHLADDQI